MSSVPSVLWTEGMLLAPQHLQQQTLYLEDLVHQRAHTTRADAWGVDTLRLDQGALLAGQVVIHSFRGVMPDGTFVVFDEASDERPTPRSLDGAPDGVVDVYLAIPDARREGANVTGSHGGAGFRFRRQSRTVRDSVTGDDEKEVEFALKNLSIVFGYEAQDGATRIKIAELVRDENGRFEEQDSYVPPCTRVAASRVLSEGLGAILRAAAAKQHALTNERRQREGSSVEYEARDVSRYLFLSALNGAIPVLRSMSEDSSTPPRELYTALVQLAGQLCTFDSQVEPMSLPLFQHADPRATFQPLFAALTSLLRGSLAADYLTIKFESREDGMHLGQLTDDAALRSGSTYVLSVASTLPADQATQVVASYGKCASWSAVGEIVKSATRGAELKALSRPHVAIPSQAGHVYFQVEWRDPHWQTALRERAVALHLPPPFRPKDTRVSLLVVVEEKG